MLTPCIACRKEVEETILTCPHCGTLGPKRVLLVPCRACGKTVGKNAHKCPNCRITAPYKNKLIRIYFCWVLFIGWVFYLSSIRSFNSTIILHEISLGDIFQIMFWIIPFSLFYTELKDYSGITNFVSLTWKTQKPPVFATCLQCKTIIHNKTEACPNCGEPVPNDI